MGDHHIKPLCFPIVHSKSILGHKIRRGLLAFDSSKHEGTTAIGIVSVGPPFLVLSSFIAHFPNHSVLLSSKSTCPSLFLSSPTVVCRVHGLGASPQLLPP
jgi:hypothetical protein